MNWIADRLVHPLAVSVIGLVVAACAGPGPQPVTRDGAVVYPLSYGFYTLAPPSFRLEPVARPGPESDLVLVFSTVPGAINGTPSGGPLREIPVQPGSTFELPLPARLPERATRFASRSLEIEPADTRVARLGTFHEYPEYGMFRGGGGFIERQSGAPLLLVYFSKPASLSGVIDDPGGVYQYEVTVERAGWCWLVARERGNDRFEVRRYTGALAGIEFAVLLPPMMLGSR